MSKITSNILKAIDYESVSAKRFENWKLLHRELRDFNRFNLQQPNTAPFMYPLYIQDASGIREALAKERIFVPTLWPNVAEKNDGSVAYDFAKNILPLPVDQRYKEPDMKKNLGGLKKCLH